MTLIFLPRYPEPRRVPTNPRWCPYARGSPREGQAPRSSNSIESRGPSPHASGAPLLAPLGRSCRLHCELSAETSRASFPLVQESEFGPLISIRWMGAPPLLPNPSRPPLPLPNLLQPPPPSPWLPPPSRSPPHSKDREEEEHVELKRKRGSMRCSTPSLLTDFLGETLGKDGILVPPSNYVLLEVVDHED
jgi:hypothetical protein